MKKKLATVLFVLFVPFVADSLAQDSTSMALKRFEVIRVDTSDIQRVPNDLRLIFADPVPDAEVVDGLAEATRRVGFTARLPRNDKTVPHFGVVAPVIEQMKISVGELRTALADAKATDVMIPDSWDGVTIDLQQRQGLFTDYGNFFIVQAPLIKLSTRSDFPADQFIEVLCRILGMDAGKSRAMRQRFAETPMEFFPIPTKYDMDIHDVKLRAGIGSLLANASKQGELALAWSDADRMYFMSGQLTEEQAIAAADSIQ